MGARSSTAAKCLYTREKTLEYDCCCSFPPRSTTKTRTKTYAKTKLVHPDTGDFFWQSSMPGTWPPRGISDVVKALIEGAIFDPVPWRGDRRIIKNKCKAKMPSSSQWGTKKKDSGVPNIWCIW